MLLFLLSAPLVCAQVVQDALLTSAGIDARARYGVADMLDRMAPYSYMAAFDNVYAPGLLRVTDLSCSDGNPCQRPVDMIAGSVGLTWRWRWIGLYYASSFNLVATRDDDSFLVYNPFLAPMFGLASLGAPINLNIERLLGENLMSGALEWSGGLKLSIPVGGDRINGVIGYYDSIDRSGAYTSLSDQELRLVFSSVLAQGIPWLLGGFREAEWLWAGVDSPGARALASSLFIRKISLQKDADVLPQISELAASAPPLWTGHIEQYNIGPVDVKVALAIRPQVMLHELLVTGNIGGAESRCGLTGGVMQLPEAPWLTVEGGPYPVVSLDCAADFGAGRAQIGLGMNTREVLTSFPYTRNAILLRYTIEAGGREE